MALKEFSSLYGFKFGYPSDWSTEFEIGRVLFHPMSEDDNTAVSLAIVQSRVQSVDDLKAQVHTVVRKIADAEILSEGQVQVGDFVGYACSLQYMDVKHSSNEQSREKSYERAYIVVFLLSGGKLSGVMSFTHISDLPNFKEHMIVPVLNSFQVNEQVAPLSQGYRRLAKDGYGVAIDFPENWLITDLNKERIAFRALEQRWQIDNVTLITSRPEEVHSLRDYFAVAHLSFKSDESVRIVKEYKDTLCKTPAYSIEYTIPDALGVVNLGKQTIGITPQGLLVNLTTLAPEENYSHYQSIFEEIRRSLIVL